MAIASSPLSLDPLRMDPGPQPRWRQAHRVWATDGRLSVFAQIEVRARNAGLMVVVGGLHDQPLVLVDHELPVPRQRWEFRSSGLWVEFVCESPIEHWSYGLEAFALGLEDGRELLGQAYGRRTPLGWELDFHAVEPPDHNELNPVEGGYHQRGMLEGVVLDERGEHLVAPMMASRWHWWGAEPEPTGVRADHPEAVALPTPDGTLWVIP